MKIAVLVAGIRFDSQRRILSGITERAAEDGSNVYIFTCDSWSYSTTYHNKGETAIFTLPDYGDYDGIILHGDTISDGEAVENMIRSIRKSGVPCVSLNVKHEGMFYLGMENANGITKIVNHLVKVHGAKRIAFISGPKGNADATGRLEAFKRTMAENKLSVPKEYIFYGDYHPESGKEAVIKFNESKLHFPDAIVAANDEMAVGAFYELEQRGYDVPGKILLTGYDHAISGRNHYPQITSVERPEIELGRRAYDMLKDSIAGKTIEEGDLLCTPVFTQSCGCEKRDKEDNIEIRRRYVKERIHLTTYSEIVKSSSANFTGAMTFDDILEKIRKYLKIMEIKEFYLCMCVVDEYYGGEPFPKAGVKGDTPNKTGYASEICIPIIYRDGCFSQHGRFQSKELLPREYTEDAYGKYYTVIPIHYQERSYGYCVLGNSRLMMDSELFHIFIMNINNALENLRKQNMLNAMVERLNRMWVYDTLTGIFNRAGFFKFAPSIIDEALRKGNDLFVFFLDLDGLKAVNDKYGHDEGDAFIKAMADVLSQVHRHGELLMRYGGDEFVVLSQGYSREDAENYIKKVQKGIAEYNQISEHPYTLEASMGYSIMAPVENLDLEAFIETADQEMYKDKNEKKRKKLEAEKMKENRP